MAKFSPTQGRYLAYIHAYTSLHGYPPAEAEIAAAIGVAGPSAHMMVKTLEKKGLILRQPGTPRSIRIIVPEDEIPAWVAPTAKGKWGRSKRSGGRSRRSSVWPPRRSSHKIVPMFPPGKLYVFTVYLLQGPVSEEFSNGPIRREIEIRGDQTLADLHEIIFQAFDRDDEHLYEFQFGQGPHDPDGPNYGVVDIYDEREDYGCAISTNIDDLKLEPGRVFGYWFDFGDDWFHSVQLERIEDAIQTVTYPRITKRTGKSPPQYPDEDEEE